jgi:hypothetical protein
LDAIVTALYQRAHIENRLSERSVVNTPAIGNQDRFGEDHG